MDINKRRVFDKWIIPKNNKSLMKHKMYVAFAVDFYIKNKKFPTVNEYQESIRKHLILIGLTKEKSKIALNHQLFQPVFFNMLEIKKGNVVPTKVGIAFLMDSNNQYLSEIIFFLFWDASFASGASGSTKEYDDIFPIRELLKNLVLNDRISFNDLNTKFYYKKPETDINNIKENDDEANDAKWAYVLSFLEESELITVEGNALNVSRKNKKYNPNSYISSTEKLRRLVFERELIKKTILSKFEIDIDDIRIDRIIENARSIEEKEKTGGRDTAAQAAYREKLIDTYGKCQFCEINYKPLLVASHIKPYSKCNDGEKFDGDNGLLLCSMHDALFDKGLLTIYNDKIILSPVLSKEDIRVIKMINIDIDFKLLSTKTKKYLRYHYENVFKEK